MKKLVCEEKKMEQQVEEAKMSRQVCGVLCPKIRESGRYLNVCELLIVFSYCGNDCIF